MKFTTLATYAGTYAAAWLTAQIAGFLALVRAFFALGAPADVAEFLSRPYVFSGLCLVLVAVIANGTKLMMWWVNNSMKLKVGELLRQNESQARLIGTLEYRVKAKR